MFYLKGIGDFWMKEQTAQLTYDIDKLLETTNKDYFNDINWKFVTEEEMEALLEAQ